MQQYTRQNVCQRSEKIGRPKNPYISPNQRLFEVKGTRDTLYKEYKHPDFETKQTMPRVAVLIKNALLTNLRVLISVMTVRF